MQTQIKSRSFQRLFASYVALMTAILLIVNITAFQRNVSEMRTSERRNNTAAAQEIAGFIDANMEALVKFAGALHNMPWVHKLYPDLKSLNDTYTIGRKREIIRELSFYSYNDMLIEKLFLVYPYRDTCIATNMWTNTHTYFKYIGLDDEGSDKLLEKIKSTKKLREIVGSFDNRQIVLCAALENISQPRAYVCYFIDKLRLTEGIKVRMPSNMASFSLKRGGELLLGVSAHDEARTKAHNLWSGYLDWEYDFEFFSDLSDYGYYERLSWSVRIFAQVFLGGLVLSWVISIFTYRPVIAILKKIAARNSGIEKVGGDYVFIERIYDKIISEHDSIMRANIIRRLLIGTFEPEEIDMSQYMIPFSNDDYYQVYLIAELAKGYMSGGGDELVFEDDERFRYEISDTPDGNIVFITAFSDENSARQSDERIRKRFGSAGRYLIAGKISQGINGISAAYRFARNKYIYLYRRTARNYSPMEWEKQLIAGLRTGNYKAVKRILSETVRRNLLGGDDSDDSVGDFIVLSTALGALYRAVDELNIAGTEILNGIVARDSIEEFWDTIDCVCLFICENIQQDKKPSMENDLLAYVAENYNHEDLSLNLIAETFGISPNTVNKLFKQSAGETFYTHLSKLRIDKAKNLLGEGVSIHTVSEMTGYSSEASFRRAFIRYAGVTPREYADCSAVDNPLSMD